jgi:hypothetical protein
MRKTNHYNKALKLLQELHTEYPNHGIGQHITTALADYGDFWGISDKEFCFALEKYQSELALDLGCLAPEEYVNQIVADAEHLFDKEEPEEEDGY